MRWLRHFFSRGISSRFPSASLQRIADAIAQGERRHTGQVCFAVEAALSLRALRRGIGARQRAQHAFARLRVWDTASNNGVLIYLLLADHRIEIVADRGLAGAAIDARWALVCEHLGARLGTGDYEAAVLDAVAEASAVLAERYPRHQVPSEDNELPDFPVLMD